MIGFFEGVNFEKKKMHVKKKVLCISFLDVSWQIVEYFCRVRKKSLHRKKTARCLDLMIFWTKNLDGCQDWGCLIYKWHKRGDTTWDNGTELYCTRSNNIFGALFSFFLFLVLIVEIMATFFSELVLSSIEKVWLSLSSKGRVVF